MPFLETTKVEIPAGYSLHPRLTLGIIHMEIRPNDQSKSGKEWLTSGDLPVNPLRLARLIELNVSNGLNQMQRTCLNVRCTFRLNWDETYPIELRNEEDAHVCDHKLV
jgi:hypothetical protein